MENTANPIDLLTKSELSIWLDSYDDIFSDFDSRSLNERSLSDDFINEARKMIREKPGGKIELRLLIPSPLRSIEKEQAIIKNLHTHFRHITHVLSSEKKRLTLHGSIMLLTGFGFMIFATYLSLLNEKTFIINSLRVIFEPAGWFLTWTGFDNLLTSLKRRNSELEFNSRMAHSEITFISI